MNKRNILVIGSGGREHALVKGIRKSPLCGKLYALPGNAGINEDAEAVDMSQSDFPAIAGFCKSNAVDFVIVGPEQPLVDGIADYLEEQGVKVFGPSKLAAQLEGSKEFMKRVVSKYNIPTAEYQSFDDPDSAKEYVRKKGAPIVVKTDGLAAGKGVTIATTIEEAEQAIDEAFNGKFGDAGKKLVIEEFLDGEEASFFVICDGEKAVHFGSAQDHKRAYDNDQGPNTGGMGTYSPAPVVTNDVFLKTMERIIKPTMEGLKKDGINYKGFLFAGLMIDKKGEPKLLEYNIRMGDPETQSIIPRIKSDLVEFFEKAIEGKLDGEPEFFDETALCVVMAAKGYPEEYQKNLPIELNDSANENAIIYHAGTKMNGDVLVSNGGRVLGVTGRGSNVTEARKNAYDACGKISFEGGFYRKDIGWRAVKN